MRIEDLTAEDWVRVNPHRRQQVIRLLTRRIGRLIFRYRGYGRERIPGEGGFIIAPNHGSYVDGFFFGSSTNRQLRFMSKYQALEWPIIGRIIRWGGGFPVRPGQDGQPALLIAERVLEAGHGLIMFMEGKLVRTPELAAPYSGLARLALRTGVPVVPVAAWGNKPAWVYGRRRFTALPKTTVVWGEPIVFAREEAPSDERVIEVRDAIWAEVARLHRYAHDLHTATGRRPRSFDLPTRASAQSAEEKLVEVSAE